MHQDPSWCELEAGVQKRKAKEKTTLLGVIQEKLMVNPSFPLAGGCTLSCGRAPVGGEPLTVKSLLVTVSTNVKAHFPAPRSYFHS